MNARRRSLFVGLLLLAALFSGLLNLYLFRRANQYYRQLNETRLDPLGLSYYSSTSPERTTRPLVVFFGDSRAAEWPAPSDLDQFEFINRGIGAQTSAQVLHRFDEHLEPLQSQVVVVQVGINDLKTIPLFPDRRESIISNCKANIEQIVDRSLQAGSVVILTTVFPVGQAPLERRPFWSPDVGQAVDEVNTYLRSLAAPKVFVLDTYALLADEHGVTKDTFARDLLHLNSAGYRVLNQELERTLMMLDSASANRTDDQ